MIQTLLRNAFGVGAQYRYERTEYLWGTVQFYLDIVQARFGELPYTLREHILALRDEAELKRLLRQSALVNTLADFCALIAQPSSP